MKPKINRSPESVVREIKRKTRRKFNSEVRVVLSHTCLTVRFACQGHLRGFVIL